MKGVEVVGLFSTCHYCIIHYYSDKHYELPLLIRKREKSIDLKLSAKLLGVGSS